MREQQNKNIGIQSVFVGAGLEICLSMHGGGVSDRIVQVPSGQVYFIELKGQGKSYHLSK